MWSIVFALLVVFVAGPIVFVVLAETAGNIHEDLLRSKEAIGHWVRSLWRRRA